ncbi:hypothetical protein GA0004736_3647 [Curtobacterium sp. 9128]|uniref:DUF6421 family protein n=1 Tax=Curtobacterium sp. 9128 TaxID=1793722 RepID=UPI0007D738A0|nr:DUF6421 family protein [Curtobacterium sp. 9128]SBN64684.1 hypothetical protein GA0004736_3647 [Curtobacterium sp. 9128]
MSQFVQRFTQDAIVGEPEVVEDRLDVHEVAALPVWHRLKDAVVSFRSLQTQDGSIPDPSDHRTASGYLATILPAVAELAPRFPHDAAYLAALQRDFSRWEEEGFGVPDFLDSLNAFQPQQHRVDGLGHLVVFPMVTQNGSSSRLVEAVLVEVIWPDFIAELEAGDYDNALFVALRFVDFTPGYDTNSAVLFPETVAMREIPAFTWGAIFQDREAARYRRVVRAAADITKLELPAEAAAMLDDQELTERVFVMWDIIHDRSHMRGDLPFDPFMIKQRMPFFLYSLEELRCDLTAFRESVRLDRELSARPELSSAELAIRDHARLVQYAVVFDRIFRFAITGSRVRNYDGLGGQLLFAWMHQHDVLHWTDTQLTIDWDEVPDVIIALSDQINELYWRSIDRPKSAHWLAAYEMLTRTLTPHPASRWAQGLPAETLAGPPKGYTDAVLDDEFPLSMFYEALNKKMAAVIASTAGITGASSVAPADVADAA